jgi:hypothetical protein
MKVFKSFGTKNSRYRTILQGLALFATYAVLAIITTWPLITKITTHLPGGSDDTLVHYWNGWAIQQALASGRFTLHTPLLFFPNGVSLVTHNIAWFNVLPWLVLEPLFDGVAAYNVALLVNLALCGCTAFFLTYRLTADYRAAFLAGLIYLAWPFRLSQLDHPNLLATQWFPIFMLFLIYTIQQGRWRDGVLTGLFFALIGYTRWQQLIPATVIALIYFVWAAPSWLPRNRRHILSRLALAGIVAAIALLPALLMLAQERGGDDVAALLREGEETVMQTDVLAYMTPAASNPLLKGQTESFYDRYYADRSGGRRFAAYVGIVALALALVGIWLRRKDSMPWVLMAIALVLLALGPLLRFNGRFYSGVPMLYRSLSATVVFRLMRVPDRYNMFLALPICVLAAYGAAGLLARTRWLAARRGALVGCLLGGLILVEYLAVPVPLQDASSSRPYYSRLADEQGDFAVLNLPIDPLKAKVYMLNQVSHGRPILQGHLSRVPADAFTFIDNDPWLRVVRQAQEMPPALSDVSRQLANLNNENIRYIIIHKWLVGADRVAHWRGYLAIDPLYEDERVVVYSTSPLAGQDIELVKEMMPGLGPVATVVSTNCVNPGRALEVDVAWGTTDALDQEFDAAVSLVDDLGRVQQSERFSLSPAWPTSQWPANSVVWGFYPLFISNSIPAGEYTTLLSLLDPEDGRTQGEPLSMQSVRVQAETCNLAEVTEAKDLNAVFGDQLRLLEYEIQRTEDRQDVTLYWRSERRMDADYKVFVHVFEPETGIPVAQDDAMPHRSAYPTTFWWPGETVKDVISIALDDVRPGAYGIAIGVYEPLTGERLPLVNSQGQLIPDGRLVLDEIVEIE